MAEAERAEWASLVSRVRAVCRKSGDGWPEHFRNRGAVEVVRRARVSRVQQLYKKTVAGIHPKPFFFTKNEKANGFPENFQRYRCGCQVVASRTPRAWPVNEG